jgi:hypothetical protein
MNGKKTRKDWEKAIKEILAERKEGMMENIKALPELLTNTISTIESSNVKDSQKVFDILNIFFSSFCSLGLLNNSKTIILEEKITEVERGIKFLPKLLERTIMEIEDPNEKNKQNSYIVFCMFCRFLSLLEPLDERIDFISKPSNTDKQQRNRDDMGGWF